MGEEKRHEMMETLFGAESEESEDEEALDRPAAPYSDDEVEGGGQVDVESEGERAGSELEREESEAERVESEAEREDSDVDHSYDEGDQTKLQKRPMAGERRGLRQQVSASGSEQSHEGGRALEQEEDEVQQFHGGHTLEEEEDEVEQVREQSEEGYDSKAADGVAEMRDVFGDSDEEEQEPDDPHGSPQIREEMSASDDEASVQRGIRIDDIVPDAEQREEPYDSDEDQPVERRAREKPVGPPLEIDIPFCPPPGPADKMHVVRVSNIMAIEPRPFDPKTYIEEEEHFITDEAGHKQRIRLEDNVARWRMARDRDGNVTHESNARFVKWSDGSMQLLIGNEVLDISVQKAHQDQAHLFLRHGKGILQSQGRLLHKMKFMPSSLSSKSHRLLTAIVDSRNRKIYKVKNVITNKDPEREKEETEKLQQKRIRSKEDLQRKQEKISRKFIPTRERAEPQLSPGYLEEALEEEEEGEDYNPGERFANIRRVQESLEEEGRAEKRIMNAKRQQSASLREPLGKRSKERRPSPPRRREVEDRISEESEHEPSEYESDGQEDDAQVNEVEDEEEEAEEAEEAEDYEDEQGKERGWDDGEDETFKKRKDREDDSEDEPSPRRKPVQRRRVVVSDSEDD